MEQRGDLTAVPPVTALARLIWDVLWAVLRRLIDDDVRLYRRVLAMPHPRWLNRAARLIAVVMDRGDGWLIGLAAYLLLHRGRRGGRRTFLQVAVPLWLTSLTVEYPLKHFFGRRRPFQKHPGAMIVGAAPKHFSFPSGHAACAFAGAWLLRRRFPAAAALLYPFAALIASSRVYMGVHYPGDVLVGGAMGRALARFYWFVLFGWRQMLGWARE